MRTLLVDAGPMVHFTQSFENPGTPRIEESIYAAGKGILIENGRIVKIEDSYVLREEYSYNGEEPAVIDDLILRSSMTTGSSPW